jgi:Tfp pilus assembly pilus retraction ATPase PilT
MANDVEMNDLLQIAVDEGASDLHISVATARSSRSIRRP